MNSDRRPIVSRMNDYDARHYTFVRNTGLPRGTFDRQLPRDPDAVVFYIMTVIGCVILGLFLSGVLW